MDRHGPEHESMIEYILETNAFHDQGQLVRCLECLGGLWQVHVSGPVPGDQITEQGNNNLQMEQHKGPKCIALGR